MIIWCGKHSPLMIFNSPYGDHRESQGGEPDRSDPKYPIPDASQNVDHPTPKSKTDNNETEET
jgi:hypothetical protein